ncbi:unnamed protein product, partial [Mesorhabditis belari]|uniref:Uncharacterized protein n=1 Tax=Mesorhabditis belari TaxID=2138241 RepID=A0AAF3FNL2_9BILA
MSNCSPNSISPSSSGGEFQKSEINSVIGGLSRSPALATSVPSHHCAVSPQDEASNDGLNKNKTQKFYFTTMMVNEAVAEIDFDNLLAWYSRKKKEKALSEANPNSASERKRKVTAPDTTETKRLKEATTAADIQKILTDESRDSNPLKQMELMTNSSALEPSGIKDVIASSCKNKEAERERNAKLEKLGEIENTLVANQQPTYQGLQRQTSESQLLAPPMHGKQEWERIVGTGSGPSTSTASTPPCPQPAQFSPMYAAPSAPLSAGAYPTPFPPYPSPQMGLNGPASAGHYPSNPAMKKQSNCSMATNGATNAPRMIQAMSPMGYPAYQPYPGWRPGMPYPISQNPAYLQWQQQAMAKGSGNLSPGAFHPQLPPGALPPNLAGYPPNMLIPNRLPPGMPHPPPYGYPGIPPHPGYQPLPGAMHPAMMVPRPGMPIDPSMNPYANFAQVQGLEKDPASKSEEAPVSDPVLAAS